MKAFNILLVLFLCLGLNGSCSEKSVNPDDGKKDTLDNISGEPYDWTITGQPERPYMHEYHKSMMMKLMMAGANVASQTTIVKTNYEDALEVIKKLDKLSRGVHKIIYLVGWQYYGHDTGFPALFEFNEALKRPQDASARDSYMWLKEEAKKYNTTISVHITMNDAYPESPLYQTYLEKDLLNREKDGSLVVQDIWGKDANFVNLTKEWNTGYAKRRIDRVNYLLDLKDSKTIHIDAFFPRESPYHDITVEDNTKTMRKIFRYWRDLGIDVTTELFKMHRTDYLIGLQPAAWWFDLSEEERGRIPAYIAAGGVSSDDLGRNQDKEFMFGSNMHAEGEIESNQNYAQIRTNFCTQSLVYFYLNTHKVQNYDAANKVVTYSDGLVVDGNSKTYNKNGISVREGNDIFLPAVWLEKEIIAYSESGYSGKTWTLPAGWESVHTISAYRVDENGLGEKSDLTVVDGKVTLSLGANQMLSLQPAN